MTDTHLRSLPFEGAANFRDVGGYPTSDGGQVRWGMVFRSGNLHGLTEADLALYSGLGVQKVFDLRGEEERVRRPDPVPSIHVPVIRSTSAEAAEIAAQRGDNGEEFLKQVYMGLIEHTASDLGRIFAGMAEPEGLPALVHCHAGKDRTGMVVALLLEILGVEREIVLDDYELTTKYRQSEQGEESYERLLKLGFSAEAAAGVLGAPRWAMADALDHVDRTYGGSGAYLTGPAGVSEDDLTRLRALLVER